MNKSAGIEGIGVKEKVLEINDVLEKLALINQTNVNPDQNYSAWKPGFLIDHIEQTHHSFVRRLCSTQ